MLNTLFQGFYAIDSECVVQLWLADTPLNVFTNVIVIAIVIVI